MTPPLASCIYEGTVRHRRLSPKAHAFSYPVYELYLDLDELPRIEAEVGLFRHNGRGLNALHDRDYMGPGGRPIKEKLREWVPAAGSEGGGEGGVVPAPPPRPRLRHDTPTETYMSLTTHT